MSGKAGFGDDRGLWKGRVHQKHPHRPHGVYPERMESYLWQRPSIPRITVTSGDLDHELKLPKRVTLRVEAYPYQQQLDPEMQQRPLFVSIAAPQNISESISTVLLGGVAIPLKLTTWSRGLAQPKDGVRIESHQSQYPLYY